MDIRFKGETAGRANRFLKVSSSKPAVVRDSTRKIRIALSDSNRDLLDRDKTYSRQIADSCVFFLFGSKTEDSYGYIVNRWNYWPKRLLSETRPHINDLFIGWEYESDRLQFYALVELHYKETDIQKTIQFRFETLVKKAIRDALRGFSVKTAEVVDIEVKLDGKICLSVGVTLTLRASGRKSFACCPIKDARLSRSEAWLASSLLARVKTSTLLLEVLMEPGFRSMHSRTVVSML